MFDRVPKSFSSPDEEVEYLRKKVAEQEKELLQRYPQEVDAGTYETLAKREVEDYAKFTPKMVLDSRYRLKTNDVHEVSKKIEQSVSPVEEIVSLIPEKGIRNVLSILEKMDNPRLIDDVHKEIILYIKNTPNVSSLKEGVPPWQILHMVLYEVVLSDGGDGDKQDFTSAVKDMKQLLLGLKTIGESDKENHFVIEIAKSGGSEHISFYVAIPIAFKELFEKQLLTLFPKAVLTEQVNDYNIFTDGYESLAVDIVPAKHSIYPFASYEEFNTDPLLMVLNSFSKLSLGEGMAVQYVIKHADNEKRKKLKDITRRIESGMSISEAIERSKVWVDMFHSFKEIISSNKTDKDNKGDDKQKEKKDEDDEEVLRLFKKKLKSELYNLNIRLVTAAESQLRAKQMAIDVKAAFNQFGNILGNQFVFEYKAGVNLKKELKKFSFREFDSKKSFSVNVDELSTLIHLAPEGSSVVTRFREAKYHTVPAPTEIPTSGVLLGINEHQGQERKIYVTEKDRMRHFYVIGQTGTGKSVFLKNLIIQDIKSGAGVCMIDPHGTDIEDVLASIPPERYEDVIYFDSSNTEYVMGLNMLEYDESKPEQKTFVVNELFSIFQKLYSANPESMGPMFEQYFRNATMLVMEDPASGNTLMDIGRVMTDANFRAYKLSRARNPVVVQFWKEVATKAGGEASLENIVPYIVSKFDVFTANDYIRPIIGQQKSAFNFRQIMDERKILLVNLAKGRLGEINANLIGMIFVGKILMAALSRVDDPSMSFPPFYLHIDEFQNVSTDSISSILSEARKYKLGLTVAHQFIAQLDPKIKDAVFGNVGSMAIFRVGNEDAKVLEQSTIPAFTAKDLSNIPNYHAVLKILANGTPTDSFSVKTMPPGEYNLSNNADLIKSSFLRYGRLKFEVEDEIRERYKQRR